jgi:hypothetical protein
MKNVNWNNATPEEFNAWQFASGLIAYNTLLPFYYNGVIAGSEFLTYAATKIYFGLSVVFSNSSAAAGAGAGLETFYDKNDVIMSYYVNSYPVWDTTAAALKYVRASYSLKNIAFSRLAATASTHIIFNGYKLLIV